jgi:hypothetical protein
MAAERNCPDESLTLGFLVEIADPPWRALLSEHRRALTTLVAEVDDQASAVRRLARTRGDSVAAVLAQAGSTRQAHA